MCIRVYNCLEPTVFGQWWLGQEKKKIQGYKVTWIVYMNDKRLLWQLWLGQYHNSASVWREGHHTVSTSMQRTPCMQNNAMHASPTNIVVLFYLKSPVLHLCVTRNVPQSVNSVTDNFSHHFCTQRYITFQVYSNECCQYVQSK